MGTVFKGLEPALERYVAIKVLRPEYASNPAYVQYFQEEARAVAALRHPNIVPIFYIGQEGNVVFFSMAYIDGETFEDYIESKRWFNEERAKWFLSHAVAALHWAHKANIVHLDIKPANFLIDRANNIMLTDFGLAQKIVKASTDTTEREAFGTPAYVAPEQITREATDQRTDIYSLGATLFHLMAGRAPFTGRTVEEIVWAHLENPFPEDVARGAGLPIGWIHLLKKMMERKPEDRFSDYRELRTALENVGSFRYETMPLQAPEPPKPLSVPRTGYSTETLHGLLARSKGQWQISDRSAASIQLSRKQVEEALKNRPEPLKIDKILPSLKGLCVDRSDDIDSLTVAMEQVPGFDPAARALCDFMTNPEEDAQRGANLTPAEVAGDAGPGTGERAGADLFRDPFRVPEVGELRLDPALAASAGLRGGPGFHLRRAGPAAHGPGVRGRGVPRRGQAGDGGAVPFSPTSRRCTARCRRKLPLVACELEMFEIDHAEIGGKWLKDRGFPAALVEAVALHEAPEKITRRSLLAHAVVSANHLVKQVGIGYSGNSLLDARPWEQLPSTGALWEARGNKDYAFDAFATDILDQFQQFPDLI